MAGKVVLTTLEEDFRRIGLITENDKSGKEKEEVPSAKPAAAEEPKKKDDDEDKDDEDEDEDEGKEKEEAVEKDGEAIDEATVAFARKDMSAKARSRRRIQRLKRRGKRGMLARVARIKRKRPAYRRQTAARAAVDRKTAGRPMPKGKVRRIIRTAGQRKRFQAMKARLSGRKPSMREDATLSMLGQVSGLLEEVQGVVSGLTEENLKEAIHGFANIAIISEYLCRAFTTLHEETEDDFSDVVNILNDLSEEAADIAKGLKESIEAADSEVDFDALTEEFQEQMELMLDGLDMYAAIFESAEAEEEDEGEAGKPAEAATK